MMLNRRDALGLAALAAPPLPAQAMTPVAQIPAQALALPDPTEMIRLWPDGAPGGEAVTVTAKVTERSSDPGYHDRFAQYTTDPILTVLRPERPNGAAAAADPRRRLHPGGDRQGGPRVARPSRPAGVTVFVLRYRLPADGWAAGPDVAAAGRPAGHAPDPRHARRLAGSIPARVAVLGFSAGGHRGRARWPRGTERDLRAGRRGRRRVAPARPVGPDVSGDRPWPSPSPTPGRARRCWARRRRRSAMRPYSLEHDGLAGAPPTFLVHALDDAVGAGREQPATAGRAAHGGRRDGGGASLRGGRATASAFA